MKPFAALVLILGMIVPNLAQAEPIYRASNAGAIVTLHSESCAIQEVSNLPKRATWEENGKTMEGCVGLSEFGMFVFYFPEDRTAFVIPTGAFRRVSSS